MLARIEALDRNERDKIFKKARELRSRHVNQATSVRRRHHFEEEDEVAPSHKPVPSLESFVIRVMREFEPADADTVGEQATVIALAKGRATVSNAAGELTLPLASDIVAAQQSRIAVGDEVLFANGTVIRVLPRRTLLSRPDPDTGGTRAIVANVDVVVVVVSVVSPPLHPRLIDRYLLAISRSGARAQLVVNKIDLLRDDERADELAKLDPYEAAGAPPIPCSVETGEGLEELRARLMGKTCAFVGHSGVGKSSLVNSLRPELNLLIGSVSGSNGRGRHTTVSSGLFDFGNGTRLIDTPGIRSLGLADLTMAELQEGFPEFDGLVCRFRGCSHVHEPGCAIRMAVESGQIDTRRYDTYRRLQEEVVK